MIKTFSMKMYQAHGGKTIQKNVLKNPLDKTVPATHMNIRIISAIYFII